MKSRNRCLNLTNYESIPSPNTLPTLITTEDVLKAFGRYRRESNETDRQMAAALGIKRVTFTAWLQGADLPKKCILARIAGFLRRVGYL